MVQRAPTQVLDGSGMACIHLTPRIKQAVKELAAGEVLSLTTDDPSARQGVPSWCRLTNNTLLETIEHNESKTTFHIQAT